MKVFKVRKGQQKIPLNNKVIDVRDKITQKGSTTLSHMCAVRKVVSENLTLIENDIRLAIKALKT